MYPENNMTSCSKKVTGKSGGATCTETAQCRTKSAEAGLPQARDPRRVLAHGGGLDARFAALQA